MDRVASWWKEGQTRMSLGAHRTACVIFLWQPHKQLSGVVFWGSGRASWDVYPRERGLVGGISGEGVRTVVQTGSYVATIVMGWLYHVIKKHVQAINTVFRTHYIDTLKLSTSGLHMTPSKTVLYLIKRQCPYHDAIDNCFDRQTTWIPW
jgi:hypothetical protein